MLGCSHSQERLWSLSVRSHEHDDGDDNAQIPYRIDERRLTRLFRISVGPPLGEYLRRRKLAKPFLPNGNSIVDTTDGRVAYMQTSQHTTFGAGALSPHSQCVVNPIWEITNTGEGNLTEIARK